MANAKYAKKKGLSLLLIVTVLLIIAALVLAYMAFGKNLKDLFKSSKKEAGGIDSSASQGTESAPSQEKLVMDEEDEWRLMLVNLQNPSPENFAPPETVNINTNHKVDSRILIQLQDMIAAAKKDGCSLEVTSGYRSYSTQKSLYDKEVSEHKAEGKTQEQAEIDASKEVARPGTSEHVTGLAVDILYSGFYSKYKEPNEAFADSKEFEWLQQHAHEYGFILRYPKGKTEITGVTYEPWHYRFVGTKHARTIKEEGLILEEYLTRFAS